MDSPKKWIVVRVVNNTNQYVGTFDSQKDASDWVKEHPSEYCIPRLLRPDEFK